MTRTKKIQLVLSGLVFAIALTIVIAAKISLVHQAIDAPSRVPGSRTVASSSAVSRLTKPMFTVTYVVDGDTIDVRDAVGNIERIRFVGIDTPESVAPRKEVQCFGKEASAYVKKILAGKTVSLEAKPDENRDAYGRLLRYVYLDEKDIGFTLLSEGFAFSVCKKFPHEKCEEYEAEAKKAESMKRGLWYACRK